MKHYSKLKENKISSKTIFKGIVGVKFDTVKLVNGHKATRLYLDHQGASAVLPVEGEYIYLVQQNLKIKKGKEIRLQSFKVTENEPIRLLFIFYKIDLIKASSTAFGVL